MRINKPFLLLGIFSGLVIQNCTPSNHPETEAEKQARLESFLNLSLEERRQLEHAMGSFVVGEGMEVELFAAEPMVVNPTNIDTDSRGRVWVCESFNYGVPEEKRTEKGGRIVILEDTDGDGKADKRTVFYQGEDVELALGIAVLGNQVFVTRSPDLLVFTDEDGDDKPDKKEKLLTGMGGPGDHSAHAVVFGPDGKLYFNMGNYGNEVHDKNGKLITDLAGREVIKNKEKYLGGMIFRLNMDGSEFETLGHNFRNNYEVAVDSYGNLWQSDNDDDGNKSVRINYILEYGNYGYLDEFTMESWYTPRTGMSDEIPRRHWHQNDPGVVPNVMITGAGSPGGILVYEGKMLPEVFHSQIIHADAGPNVVRGYISQKTGAGYQAKIQPIFQSKYDQWSRP
ncbi:MAG: PQQ-dependent sugar dehydrogenase, partial [Bacteroidetes bacterium]|nr:PQQ-dependent sugar dehydrogenase [Bacteroidota bacterium]